MSGPLPREFFARRATEVAPELVGVRLEAGGVGGIIVETEAYEGDDPACHGFVGRTARTETLFGPPGHAYVYLCYGIHRMLNVVTSPEGTVGAVLVRAIEPDRGLGPMRERRGVERDRQLCSGPGKLSQALGIELADDAVDLCAGRGPVTIGPRERSPALLAGPRIGITRAVDYPWRWCERDSGWLSAAGAPQRQRRDSH